MKVYLSEQIAPSAYQRLKENMVIVNDFKDAETLDAILIRRVIVNREIIERASSLKIISMHGVGCDTIDVAAAKEKQISVTNVPGASAESVAELAVTFMLALSRKLKLAGKSIACDKYTTFAPTELIGSELYGKTVGLIGMGNVSMKVGSILQKAFSMQIIGYDPYSDEEIARKAGIKKFATVEEVFQKADFIHISVPLNNSTKNLINRDILKQAKPSLILVNTSRGGVVNETDLYQALIHKQITAAASDVFLSEPPGSNNPLIHLPNFIATPHIGGSTKESLERVSNAAVDHIFAALGIEEKAISYSNINEK